MNYSNDNFGPRPMHILFAYCIAELIGILLAIAGGLFSFYASGGFWIASIAVMAAGVIVALGCLWPIAGARRYKILFETDSVLIDTLSCHERILYADIKTVEENGDETWIQLRSGKSILLRTLEIRNGDYHDLRRRLRERIAALR